METINLDERRRQHELRVQAQAQMRMHIDRMNQTREQLRQQLLAQQMRNHQRLHTIQHARAVAMADPRVRPQFELFHYLLLHHIMIT